MRARRVIGVAAGVVSALALAGSNTGSAFFNVPLTPGHFRTSGQFLFAGMFDSSGDQISIAFDYGRLQFRPKGGGPLIPVNGTMVFASVSTPDGLFGSGCWLVNGDPITVNRDLSATAAFDSTSSSVQPCPGALVSESLTAAAPQLSNLDPEQGLSGPVTFSLQWTPTTPPDAVHSVINGTCQNWTSVEQITTSNVGSFAAADVSMTVVGLNFNTGNPETVTINGHFDTTGGPASVAVEQDDEVVNGPATGNCGPYGS